MAQSMFSLVPKKKYVLNGGSSSSFLHLTISESTFRIGEEAHSKEHLKQQLLRATGVEGEVDTGSLDFDSQGISI